jgi:hypothetical protein
VGQVFKEMNTRVNQCQAAIPRGKHTASFQLTTAQNVPKRSNPTPAGFEELNTALLITVSLNPHRLSQTVLFSAFSKGKQCVLMRRKLRPLNAHGAAAPVGDWEPLLWFDPEALPAAERFTDFVKESLVALR